MHKPLLKSLLCIIPAIIFIPMAWHYLLADGGELLYAVQSRSYFSDESTYLNKCLSQPGGLLTWLATYLTQYFYQPETGAAILIAVWTAAVLALLPSLKVKACWLPLLTIPAWALLASDVSMGYWLYYIKLKGFWFMGGVGLLSAALLNLPARLIDAGEKHLRPTAKIRFGVAAWCIIEALTYPLFGFYSLLALAFTGVTYLRNIAAAVAAVAAVAAIIITPVIAYQCFTSTALDKMWTIGLPEFSQELYINNSLLIPYIIMAVAPLLVALIPRNLQLNLKRTVMVLAVNVLGVAALAYMVDKWHYDDKNFTAELAMYRAAEDMNWEDCLAAMDKGDIEPTRQMVILKNISLMNLGTIGNEMFKYPNTSQLPRPADSIRVKLSNTAGPLIYLHHGCTNFSIRWSIENTVENGLTFTDLRTMTLCAFANDEYLLARKYLTMLLHSRNYKEWAERYLPITYNHKLISEHHELDNIRELRHHRSNIVDSDASYPEKYLIHNFSGVMNKDSRYLQEWTLVYALVTQNIQTFWPRFFLYATLHEGDHIPTYYQQAAYLYGQLEHEVDTSHMPFDQDVVDSYNNFWNTTQKLLSTGMTTDQVKDATRSTFGDTFYWFYYFCRGIEMY